MTWDDDSLEYGYIVTRPPDGGWWHLHFGRAAVAYDCELLGRQTDVLAVVQHFAAGAAARSPQYVLTLDGEGVERSMSDLKLDFRWDRDADDDQLAGDARHFQREVMPLVHDSPAMQHAVAEIVHRDRHLRLVAAGKLRAAGGPAAA
jgi:hypothetical protein